MNIVPFTMNASARREKHKNELRAEMLEAAREIFGRDGYEGFSMRKLAQRMYFKDKNEIFDRLVEESFTRLLESLPQPSGASDEANDEVQRAFQLDANKPTRLPCCGPKISVFAQDVWRRPRQSHRLVPEVDDD
jgi:AcrR family transcriptional regulator